MITDFQSLLYIGDVTVEPTHAGSLLLWRLLEAWPQEKIRLLEFVSSERKTDQKLPNTSTHLLPFAGFSRSRFNHLHSEILTRSGFLNRNVLEQALRESNSDAILSVAHGWSWIWAANFALRENIPYHLIVHDDFPSFHPRLGRKMLENNCRLFRRIVSNAASVFCVSETMKVVYEREFKGEFDVLLPSRGKGQKCELGFPSGDPLRRVPQVVYAGSINCESIARSLRAFAEEMENGELGMLIVYSDIEDSPLLDHPRITLRPMVPPDQTFDLLRKEADFLLLLMNFDGEAARNMQMC
ncbi:glycosyltransferase, partial [Akkermansiaceae bacterium]|nr:glycosyltransferase [Akkermansiaceae bacterium]